MKKEEFLNLLDIYGSDFERWPSEKRISASMFIDTADEETVALWKAESAFDGMLSVAKENLPISIALETALIDMAPTPEVRSTGTSTRFGWLPNLQAPKWVSASVMCASLFGGVSVGYAQSVEQVELAAADAVMIYVSDQDYGSDVEWSDMESSDYE